MNPLVKICQSSLNLAFLFLFTFISFNSKAQLTVNNSGNNSSGVWLVENILLGSGIQVSNVTLSKGDSTRQVGYFDANTANIGVSSGIILSSGKVTDALGPNNMTNTGTQINTLSTPDADLTALIGTTNIRDAVVLEFDFVATQSSYVFNYIFASEEYNEYVGSSYNDVFGFFLSGPGISGTFSNNAINIALIPGTTTAVSVNNVNDAANSIYYINNEGIPNAPIEYDGYTTPFRAELNNLVCGQTYHIKIALSDVSDANYDSAVLLEQGSFKVNGFNIFTEDVNGDLDTNRLFIEGCQGTNIVITRLDTTEIDSVPLHILGSAQMGADYSSFDSLIIFPQGVEEIVIPFETLTDNLTEGTETVSIYLPYSTGCLADSVISLELVILDSYEVDRIVTNETCTQGNGSIEIIPHSTLIYEVTWNDGDSLLTKNSLSAGIYSATITDNLGCEQIISDTIVNHFIDSLTLTQTADISCYGVCEASFEANVIGGVAPYTYYTILNNDTLLSSAIQDSVCAGIYEIMVMDANGCTSFASIEITAPDSLSALTFSLDAICGDSGNAEINVSGGVTPYSYNWSNGQTTSSITGLLGGVYTVTVADSNNCIITRTITINQFDSLTATFNVGNLLCYDDTAGSAEILVAGGMGAYSYAWSNGDSTALIQNLVPGVYSVTVSDISGCSYIDSIEITQPDSLIINFNVQNPLCFGGSDGSVELIVSGGVAPYTFIWWANSAETGPVLDSLAVGTYFVNIIDSLGCSKFVNATLVEPSELVLDATINNEICQNANGSVCLTVSGGTLAYTYAWNNGQTIDCVSNLSAGTYDVTVTDINNCAKTGSYQVLDSNVNCCNYFVSIDSVDCATDTICVALNATNSVSNGIVGMDFCLKYDTTVVSPSGNASLGSVVYSSLGQGNGEEIALNTSVPGYIFGTIFYNSSVPLGTFWNGSGEVGCIEFIINSDSATGFSPISVCAIDESYTLYQVTQCATDGGLEFAGNNNLKSQIVFWNYDDVQNSPLKPLKYDVTNPGAYLETEMSNSTNTYTVLPDLNGEVSWDLNYGDSVMIVRDIMGTYGDTGTSCSDVFLVINGYDNYLAALIATFNTNNVDDTTGFWVPNVYQMIAADVNMNDQVRASDNTLIAQRSIRSICEYPQLWNYTNTINPVPTGVGASLDWRFVDRDITGNSDFQVDPAYPVYFAPNATSGYWRDDLPDFTQLIPLNLNDSLCPSFQEKAFYGVLLGDIDGNWDYELNAATLKTNTVDQMVFSANPTANSNIYRIQVSYDMANSLASLDFRLGYNSDKLNILNVGTLASNIGMVMNWNDFEQNTLYLSSYTLTAPQTNSAVYYIDVELLYGQLEITDFESITSLLNGKVVVSEVQIDGTTLHVNTESIVNQVSVYPNPALNELNIKLSNVASEEVNIYLTNSLGQLLFKDKTKSTQYFNTLDISKFSKGVYNLSVVANGSNYTQKVIIK